MAKVTVKLMAQGLDLRPECKRLHGREVKLPVLPSRGDHLKEDATYVEVIGIVHDISTGSTILVIR